MVGYKVNFGINRKGGDSKVIFGKNLQIFQEQCHIENLGKLADYCILNNDVNINHFKTHKNHKI